MKTEFKNKKYSRRSHARTKWLIIFIFMLIILLFASGVFIYKHKKPLVLTQIFTSEFNRVKSWLDERKQGWRKNLVKTQPVVNHKDEIKPDIHFEFYTALPRMQIKVQENPKPENITNDAKIFDAEKLQHSLANEIHKSEK